MDSPKHLAEEHAFYELGVPNMVAISATHGNNVAELAEKLLNTLPPKNDEDEPDEQPVSISIIGQPNVGKSTFFNALLGEERSIVSDIAGTTRDAVSDTVEYNDAVYSIMDTAGFRKNKNKKMSLRNLLTFVQKKRLKTVTLLF